MDEILLLGLESPQIKFVSAQGAFYVDPFHFFSILLLRHDNANLEMMWSSQMMKPLWFPYCLANFPSEELPIVHV